MTKKDYIAIARAINRANLTPLQRQSVVAELGRELIQDNPKFSYDRFKAACFEGLPIPGRPRHSGQGAQAMNHQATSQSGYCACACRDCFEIAIKDADEDTAMCGQCEEAGCYLGGDCQVEDNDEDSIQD